MTKKNPESTKSSTLTCGLIMPISPIDGCSAEHWMEVKNIISDAVSSIEDLKFVTKIVSDQDDVGVIQKRIVQNIFDSDIVICDVSCKNANVMFELGMRLAFDKPTILIKDDQTDFSFDTGVIEHLLYPRDLRFSRIVAFKAALADKVVATYRAASGDPNYSTFLKHFGSFKVASIDQAVYTPDEAILTMIQDLSQDVSVIRKRLANVSLPMAVSTNSPPPPPLYQYKFIVTGRYENIDAFIAYIKTGVKAVFVREIVSADSNGARTFEIHSPRHLDNHFISEGSVKCGVELSVSVV
ncbi:hypothetical protein ABGT16_05760 [Pseudomonas asiatica]|uniref:hypothetical protein n=1 Tax=Pseudomonas asiatica TaxID=2219225 RepID=UPI00345C7C2E